MFDLDHAMREWRRRMRAAGLKSPVLLDELESHLRDDVEEQIKAGVEVRLAFVSGTHRMGLATELKSEFAKSNPYQPMKQNLIHLAVIVATLAIGAALALPSIVRWQAQETLGAMGIAVLLVGAAIFFYGAGCGAIGIREHLKNRSKA